MIAYRPLSTRKGGVAFITLLLLIPLMLVVAFAIDLNYIWSTDAELQSAADAAALAGASRLLASGQATPLTGVNPAVLANKKQTANANATSTAQSYAQMHRAGGVQLAQNTSDIEVGYIPLPANADQTGGFQGPFQPTPPQFPNFVKVVARRDATVRTGPLSLFFGGVFGTPTSSRVTTATAVLLDQTVTGFNGSGCKLLPLAMDLATYNWLRGVSAAPPGAVSQDLFTVNTPLDSGLSPPSNVQSGADGIPEGKIYPDSTAPGNFGLVSLTNGKATSQPAYDNWIRNGPSTGDLASFGPNGLQASSIAAQSMYGGPGLKASLQGALQSIVGQPRILILYTSVSGNGANTQYQVVGFVGATVVSANLQGGTKEVIVQLSPTIDPTATPAKSSGTGSAHLVYTGVSLSR